MGVTRLDGPRGMNQVWRPMFERELYWMQMYWIEETRKYLWHFWDFSTRPQSFGAPIVIRRQGNCAPLVRPRYAPAVTTAALSSTVPLAACPVYVDLQLLGEEVTMMRCEVLISSSEIFSAYLSVPVVLASAPCTSLEHRHPSWTKTLSRQFHVVSGYLMGMFLKAKAITTALGRTNWLFH